MSTEKKPVEVEAEDVQQDEQEQPELDVYEPVDDGPARQATKLKVKLLSADANVFVKEWTFKNMFAMIKSFNSILKRLKDRRLFARSVRDEESGEIVELDDAERNQRLITSIVETIGESQDEITSIILGSVYTTKACAHDDLVETEFVEDLTVADIVRIVRGVVIVNWERGGLGKSLAEAFGSVAGEASTSKKPKVKLKK